MIIQLSEILKDTDYNIRLKNKVNFRNPEDYLHIIVDFANQHKIGYLIFGVENNTKKIIGIKNVKKSYTNIMNNIKDMVKPKIVFIIEIINIKNKNIILVKIIPESSQHYFLQ